MPGRDFAGSRRHLNGGVAGPVVPVYKTGMATGRDEEAPSLFSLRQEARTIYGRDAPGYEAGRPDYPGELYEILTSR